MLLGSGFAKLGEKWEGKTERKGELVVELWKKGRVGGSGRKNLRDCMREIEGQWERRREGKVEKMITLRRVICQLLNLTLLDKRLKNL